MKYDLKKADKKQAGLIYELVQNTIAAIYPKYYPKEVVDFFSQHHTKTAVARDIELENARVLLYGGQVIGTGSYQDNHITRVYIAPAFQGMGFGGMLVKQLEQEIASGYDTVFLEASLPAVCFYEKIGYSTVRHEKICVANDAVFVYEIMRKRILMPAPLPPRAFPADG